jgi:hypothetical protein
VLERSGDSEIPHFFEKSGILAAGWQIFGSTCNAFHRFCL